MTIDLRVDREAEVKASKLLAEKIERSSKLKALEAQRVKIQKKRIDKFKRFLFSTGVNLSKTIPALAIMSLCVAAGLPLGLNILPSAVACKSVDSLCYHLRLNKKTTIAPDKSVVKDKRVAPLKKKTKRKR